MVIGCLVCWVVIGRQVSSGKRGLEQHVGGQDTGILQVGKEIKLLVLANKELACIV